MSNATQQTRSKEMNLSKNNFLTCAKKIINYNCDLLDVDTPKLNIVSPNFFATPTMQAAMRKDGKEIIINSDFRDKWIERNDLIALFLCLSHECRHIWQTECTAFKSYKPRAELSLKDYNNQFEEIDAWAWASLIIEINFNVRPTLEKTLGEELYNKIRERKIQIFQNEFSDQ
jgi:hypothetical protein